jgi:hypothetical protein
MPRNSPVVSTNVQRQRPGNAFRVVNTHPVRVRHDPYAASVLQVLKKDRWVFVPPRACDAMAVDVASLPPREALLDPRGVPIAAEFLRRCRFVPYTEVLAVGIAAAAEDAAYAAEHGPWVFDASICVGQVCYTRSAVEHRGMLALQLPGVRMSPPTIHAYAAGRGRQLPGSRQAHTGLVHVNVRAQDVDVIVQAANQRAYYDLQGVWLAANAEAARELAAWELVMRHYRNGTPNRLPMSLVTIERARTVFQAQ